MRTSAQNQLRPVIAQLLRTRVLPETVLLRVEKIIPETVVVGGDDAIAPNVTPDSGNGDGQEKGERREVAADKFDRSSTTRVGEAFRLFLTDGELLIAGLLHASLHYLPRSRRIVVGSLLRLKRFKVSLANRLNGNGQVVYLAIEDLEVAVVSETSMKRPVAAAAPTGETADGEEKEFEGGKFIRQDGEQLGNSKRPAKRPRVTFQDNPVIIEPPDHVGNQDTDSDGFESIPVQDELASRRRAALKRLNSSGGPKKTTEAIPERLRKTITPDSVSRNHISSFPESPVQHFVDNKVPLSAIPPEPEHGAAPVTHSETSAGLLSRPLPSSPAEATNQVPAPTPPPPAPLHTLDSLIHPPHPLPSRKYHCTVFAVISWVSPSIIDKPASTFPPKRHIRIHDPSISHRAASVTVAVFVDARKFLPQVGTVALFRGLTMHRWEGEVILNAYVSLKGRKGEDAWFVDDPITLTQLGFDVEGMRGWWEARRKKRKGGN